MSGGFLLNNTAVPPTTGCPPSLAAPADYLGPFRIDSVTGAIWITLGTVASAEVIADQTGIGTGATDLTGATVTITAQAGRKYRIFGKAQFIQGASAALVEMRLLENAGQIDASDIVLAGAAGRQGTVERIRTLGAGTFVYKLQALADAGTATLSASAALPCQINVMDVGPA